MPECGEPFVSCPTMSASEESESSAAARQMNRDVWKEQLAGVVSELGADSPDIRICAYPEHTFDHNAKPLLIARPNDFDATLSRLRTDFGGGVFWVIVFVRGEIRRRFSLLV